MLVKNWPCGCLICTDVRLRRNDDVQQPDQSKVTVPLVCMLWVQPSKANFTEASISTIQLCTTTTHVFSQSAT